MNLLIFVRKHLGILLFVGLALLGVTLGFADLMMAEEFSAGAVIFPAFNGVVCAMMVLMLLMVVNFFSERTTVLFELFSIILPLGLLVAQQYDSNPYTAKLEHFSIVLINVAIGSVVGWLIYKLTKRLSKVA